MKRFNLLYIFLLIFIPCVSLKAFDFGLVTYQNAGYGNRESALSSNENKFDYQANIIPHISFPVGENGEFYLSAGMALGADSGFYYVPELMRTEITLRSGPLGIKIGRMLYSDPLNFIAEGLFDGVQFFYNTKSGTFNAGIWYTGLLYKKSANITMTDDERFSYDAPLDYSDFSNTYFAPRRLLAALDWEHPSVTQLLQLRASFINQTDLSGGEKFHTQYLILKAGIHIKSFLFEIGGSLETAETASEDNINMAFAWDFGVAWTLPASFTSKLSLAGHFAGGGTDVFSAFVPVTTKYYGDVFRPKLSGLSVIDLNYTARINEEIGTKLSALYFVRNDLGTYSDYPISGNDGYFLGAEIFARVIWSIFSDVQLNAGAGAFFPSLGNSGPDEKARWRIEMGAIIALY